MGTVSGDKYMGSIPPPSPVPLGWHGWAHQLRSKAAHFLGLAYELLLQVFHLPAQSRGMLSLDSLLQPTPRPLAQTQSPSPPCAQASGHTWDSRCKAPGPVLTALSTLSRHRTSQSGLTGESGERVQPR